MRSRIVGTELGVPLRVGRLNLVGADLPDQGDRSLARPAGDPGRPLSRFL